MVPMPQVLYMAAHSGFALDRVPLGGGGTVAAWLETEWSRTRPFPFRMLRPDLLGAEAPRDKDLVRYSERAYARFCRRFERVGTDAILKEDPRDTVVLCNDISEGPDVRRLADMGFSVWTIFHVDVVDYFCRLYLRGRVRPETMTRLYDRIIRSPASVLFPDLLKLVFQKQADSVRHSKGLIVMSQAMRDTLLRCYPDAPAERVHVCPWGLPEPSVDDAAVAQARRSLDARFPALPGGGPVLVSLSRMTPEKGQDRLLQALALWEKKASYPAAGVTYVLIGEAAYMQGVRFESRLRRLASRLRRTRVHFTGYLAGAEKQAALERADLYVFPSRHDSYGLTLLEAMRAGLPALTTASYGAMDVMTPDRGRLLPPLAEHKVPAALCGALEEMCVDRERLRRQGRAAREFALTQRFSDAAARLAGLLIHHGNK